MLLTSAQCWHSERGWIPKSCASPPTCSPATAASGAGRPGCARSGRRAGRRPRTWLGTSHRQAAGQVGRRRRPARPGASCSPCPTGGRSCSATAARRCSGTSPRSGCPRPQRAPRVRGVLVQVRRGGAARHPTSRSRRSSRRRRATHPLPMPQDDIDLYALTHNETSTGVAMHLQRPLGMEPDALVAVDATSAPPAACRGPRRRSTSTTSPRRSASPPTAGCGWRPARRRRSSASGELAAGDRWIPASLSLSIALENSRLDQTYNTPALATLFLLDAAGALDERAGRPRLVRRAHPPSRRRSCTSGPHDSEYADAVRARPGEALGGGRHDRPRPASEGGVDAADVCAALRANGIVDIDVVPQARPQPAADRHVPVGTDPATSKRSPGASTTRSPR